MVSLLGRKTITLGKVPAGTRILCLGAHPDDFEGGCPNTVLSWVRAGADVTMALSTGGEYGLQRKFVRFYGKRLRAIRAREMRQAINAYGTNADGTPKITFRWLGFIDGFVQVNPTLLSRIQRLIEESRPQILVILDPYLPLDWHRDHRRTGYAALKVLQKLPPANRPTVVLGFLSRECNFFIPYKRRGDAFSFFRIHRSQTGYAVMGWGWELIHKFMHLLLWACHLNNKRKCGTWAEGFRLIRSPFVVPPVPPQLRHRVKYAATHKNYGPVKRSRYVPLPEELGLSRE